MNGNNNDPLQNLIKHLKFLGTEQTLGIAKILEEIEVDKNPSSPQTLYQGSVTPEEEEVYADFFLGPIPRKPKKNQVLELLSNTQTLNSSSEVVLYPHPSGLYVYTNPNPPIFSSVNVALRREELRVIDGGYSNLMYK